MRPRLMLFIAVVLLSSTLYGQESATPEARSGHDLVWHGGLEMILLVNGDHQTTDDPGVIWSWDGQHWQIVSDDAPPAHTLGGVAYDAANDLLLLHGGSQSAEDYSDLTSMWRSNGNGRTWEAVSGTNPGARDHLSMVYDSAREQIVLFGGQFFPTSTFYEDTWVWDGEDTGWSQVATTGPGIRYHYAMTYDSVRQQVLVFGGTTGSADQNDLWAWDGEAWSQIDRGTGPARRFGARMTFDEKTGVVVLFGGLSNPGALEDTWLWDGEQWMEFSGDTAPSARSHHAMAYDPLREKVVLFGGYSQNNLNDTWEWDLENGWTNATDG